MNYYTTCYRPNKEHYKENYRKQQYVYHSHLDLRVLSLHIDFLTMNICEVGLHINGVKAGSDEVNHVLQTIMVK